VPHVPVASPDDADLDSLDEEVIGAYWRAEVEREVFCGCEPVVVILGSQRGTVDQVLIGHPGGQRLCRIPVAREGRLKESFTSAMASLEAICGVLDARE